MPLLFNRRLVNWSPCEGSPDNPRVPGVHVLYDQRVHEAAQVRAAKPISRLGLCGVHS